MKKQMNTGLMALLVATACISVLSAAPIDGFDLCKSDFPLPIAPDVQTLVDQGCREIQSGKESQAFITFSEAAALLSQKKSMVQDIINKGVELKNQQVDMLHYILTLRALDFYKDHLSPEMELRVREISESAFEAVHDHMVALGTQHELTPALRDVFCNLVVHLMGKVVPNSHDYTKEFCLRTTFGASQDPDSKINLRDESQMINMTVHNERNKLEL